MRRRLGLGLLAGVAASLLFVASASACQIANLVLPSSAGPGDNVSYSISGIEPNATYSFTIAGTTVSGTNTTGNNGVSGTFTMPDLGSQAQTLTADGQCSCPDGPPAGLVAHMQYLPPPPPSSAAPAATSSEPAATTQAAGHTARTHAHHSSPQLAVAKHRHAPASSGAAVGTASAGSVGSDPSAGISNSASGRTEQSSAKHSAEHSSVPHQILNALGSSTKVGPAKVPTIGLLLMAIIFIAGTALAAFLVAALQKGPDPLAAINAPAPVPEDPVEAELQEMIADEMARQVIVDLELGEGVSSLTE